MTSRFLTTNYISWEVHSGDNVKFWIDSWNGFLTFASNVVLRDVSFIAIYCWGSKVVNYISTNDILLGKVIWKDFTKIPILPNEATFFNSLLSSRIVRDDKNS